MEITRNAPRRSNELDQFKIVMKQLQNARFGPLADSFYYHRLCPLLSEKQTLKAAPRNGSYGP